ncbi:ANTAR domain-containing protein [Arthrobacter castelli]|uniref:ANTAR domain-containing protein n=1 Tax=Arthrobacter castelli TaxID=271431 RepID=UPI00041A32F7|nr:ANTAR domain-containing protein [Arthrobacter castelli]
MSAEYCGTVEVDEVTGGQARKIEELEEALASRDIIGQAKGILMERYKITAEQAFSFLIPAQPRPQHETTRRRRSSHPHRRHSTVKTRRTGATCP